MTKQMSIREKIELLEKVSRIKCSTDIKSSELETLVDLLNLDELFENFPEADLRSYRNALSGQPITGMTINRNNVGEVMSFSFVPHAYATRAQLYEGLIFSIINPAARNLTQVLKWLDLSDYARMGISTAASWGSLADTIVKVKDWAKYLDIVRNPGEVFAPPFSGQATSNLLALDALIFNNITSPFDPAKLERHESFDYV